MGDGKALTRSSQELQRAAAERVDEKLRRETRAVVDAALKAAELDDDELLTDEHGKVIARNPPARPEGMSDREFRIARDARRSGREAPVYLSMAASIDAQYRKADLERDPGDKPLNVQYATTNVQVNIYQYGAREYEVIDAEEGKDE